MKHFLLAGTWTPPGAIFTFEFDDETLSLKLVKRTEIPHDEPISWMAFDVSVRALLEFANSKKKQKKNVYGASMKTFSSYTVETPTEIAHHSSHAIAGHPSAANKDSNTRAIFVLAAKQPPFNVYGNPFYDFAGYGNVFSVDGGGGLLKNVQNYEYLPHSAVHDMHANKIWTHKKTDSGMSLLGSVDAPNPGDHPRWVEYHPAGYLYALMEAGNNLAVYVIDEDTHLPVFTRIVYPLIPPGLLELFPKMYRADVVVLSHSKKYLFATSRANSYDLQGYISAFKVDPKGLIERQLFINPTPTSGGHSNAVSPCDFSDEWLALTDDQIGSIEIYRFHEEYLARVAHLDVKEPGFGMNAIWYN